ncbi:MAG TPA: metal-dependent hydrolase [Polyangiaceae bacterium]|nr:metal-dependent hydrolase [Polyangiaceae bacterium]
MATPPLEPPPETAPPPAPAPALRVRAPSFALDEVPRHWFAGNAIATHLTNGVSALFPAGERFFVRSVRHYLGALGDGALAAEVRAFCGQEGRHAQAHERFLRVLRAQGYDLTAFLKVYETIAFGLIEPAMSPPLRLAVTAACEHYTALMAEGALGEDDILRGAHPVARELLLWHAAEEIEHKAVAFDVLARVAPSYRLRVLGLALATALLSGFWVAATATLLAADARAGRLPRRADAAAIRTRRRSIVRDVFGRGLREYARRDFHPWGRDNRHLAADYLARAGLEPGGAGPPPAA